LQNLEDASDDLLLVEDESEPIPFVVGEVFVHFSMDETKVDQIKIEIKQTGLKQSLYPLQEKLEEAKRKVKQDIEGIEAECTAIKAVMSDLKTQLYAKFGTSINLEADEE